MLRPLIARTLRSRPGAATTISTTLSTASRKPISTTSRKPFSTTTASMSCAHAFDAFNRAYAAEQDGNQLPVRPSKKLAIVTCMVRARPSLVAQLRMSR